MLTGEQLASKVIEHGQEIARIFEHSKSAHKRIDDNEKIIASIHELAKNVAAMASEIKLLTGRMDASIDEIKSGQKAQGERIGSIEKTVLTIERNEKYIDDLKKRVDAIEKAPAKKWDKFMWLIFGGVVTAVLGFILARILQQQ